MRTQLGHITNLSTGIYAKPDFSADTLYLQANHFSEMGFVNGSVKPLLQLSNKYEKHLLGDNDILFAAKGFNNFAVVYHKTIGQAVASSSFIIIRVVDQYKPLVLPEFLVWYLNNNKEVEIFHKAKAASTVPSISISQLSELSINIPDVKTQKQIITLQNLRMKEKHLISKIEELKDKQIQSLLLLKTAKDEN